MQYYFDFFLNNLISFLNLNLMIYCPTLPALLCNRKNPDMVVSVQWGDYSLKCLCSLVINTDGCSVEMIWYGSLFQSTIVLGKNEY